MQKLKLKVFLNYRQQENRRVFSRVMQPDLQVSGSLVQTRDALKLKVASVC